MKDPQDRLERELKTRFTHNHYAVVEWCAQQAGLSPSEFVRQCALERMAQLAALSASSEGQGRAA